MTTAIRTTTTISARAAGRTAARGAVVAAPLLLAACANNVKPEDLPQFRVTGVNVTTAPGVKASSDIASAVRAETRRVAAAYAAPLPANLPGRTLDVRVTSVKYKNAVASLLVGSANQATGTVTGGAAGPGQIVYTDAGSAAINGVIGAVAAMNADKAKVDRKLAGGLAQKAVAQAYGQKGTPRFVLDRLGPR